MRDRLNLFIYFIVILFALLPFISMYVQPKLDIQTIQDSLETNNKEQARQQLEKLLHQKIPEKQKWELIQDYIIRDRYYDLYTGPSMTTWETYGNVFTNKEAAPYLREYMKDGPNNAYMVSAAIQLATYYVEQADYKAAQEILRKATNRALLNKSSYYVTELFQKQIQIALTQKDYSQAEALLKQLKEIEKDSLIDSDIPVLISLLETEILLQKGELQTAYQKVSEDLAAIRQQWEEENKHFQGEDPFEHSFTDGVYARELETLKNKLSKAIANGTSVLSTVGGRITRADGVPMSGVGVFLREKDTVYMSVQDDEQPYTWTDENGYFQFPSVLPGSYQIHLGLTRDQVDGWKWLVDADDWIDVKEGVQVIYNIEFQPLMHVEAPANHEVITTQQVHFKWEQVPQAKYYDVNVCLEFENGSICSDFKSNINQNEITIPIEGLYAESMGISYDGEGSIIDTVRPESLLGFSNPEGTFSWYVRAYNQNDQPISESKGYFSAQQTTENPPIFYLKERTLTKADRLLLNKKILEALDLYKQAVDENPNDLHSLRMITRLIGFETAGEDVENRYHIHNTEAALPYLQLLAEKQPTEDSVFQLLSYYFENKDWKEFNDWYEKYKDIVKEEVPSYVESLYATAQMHQGNLQLARQLYYEILQKDYSHRFVGNLLAIELYLHDSVDEALEVAQTYPLRESYAVDWTTFINDVATIPKAELNEALELYFYGEDEEIQTFLDSKQNTPIGNLIKQLQNVR